MALVIKPESTTCKANTLSLYYSSSLKVCVSDPPILLPFLLLTCVIQDTDLLPWGKAVGATHKEHENPTNLCR